MKSYLSCIIISLLIGMFAFPFNSYGGMGLCLMPEAEELVQRGFRQIGENSADKFPEIAGPETVIRVYWKQGEKVGLYVLPNEEIYAYAVKKDNQPMVTYVDEDNDGYCDRTIEAMEDFEINFDAYGITLK
ncbi:MAG: hypothetical protein ACNI27_13230 [Desulfovibrio sp.]